MYAAANPQDGADEEVNTLPSRQSRAEQTGIRL